MKKLAILLTILAFNILPTAVEIDTKTEQTVRSPRPAPGGTLMITKQEKKVIY